MRGQKRRQSMAKEALKMSHIMKVYSNGVMANKDVTLSVSEGEIHALSGENGAGKSTTIKMMTGILNPSSGICEINNFVPYTQREEYVKDIGVVFGQRTQLWWDLPLNDTFKVLKEIYEVNTSTGCYS